MYRLRLLDTGGDGWQGARYVVVNSSSLSTGRALEPGATLFANGTLASGFAGYVYMCLPDGCYEIEVGGGAADSTSRASLTEPRGAGTRAGADSTAEDRAPV